MEYKFYTSSGELYHWGIKGMKWGVRRYQNKDGSLTAAGKKRRAKLEGELEKLGGGKTSSNSGDSPDSGTKSVSEMSNKELQERTTRMQLEANYINAQRNLASMNPKQVSKGKQMAEKILKDSILPAVSKTTQSYLENYLKKTLGLDTKDELAELRRKADILDAKQRIDKHMNPEKYMSYEEKTKRFNLEESKRKAAADYKSLEETKKELEKTRKELEEERKKNRTEQGDS